MPAAQPRATTLGSAGAVLGLRQNLAQFMLLVAVNALVGGTLGQERTVLPLLASQDIPPGPVHKRADLHPRLRPVQGRDELLRGNTL